MGGTFDPPTQVTINCNNHPPPPPPPLSSIPTYAILIIILTVHPSVSPSVSFRPTRRYDFVASPTALLYWPVKTPVVSSNSSMIICEPNSLCHFDWAQNWVPVNVEEDVNISVCNRLGCLSTASCQH